MIGKPIIFLAMKLWVDTNIMGKAKKNILL